MKNRISIVIVLAVMLMLSGIASANLSHGVQVSTASNMPPVITILGDNPATVERYSTYTDAGATATDTEDGDLTGNVAVTGTVDVNTVGTYTITYTITDSQGATDIKTRTVNVVDTIAPADVTGVVIGTVTQTTIPLSWSNADANLSPDFTNVVITVRLHSDSSIVSGWDAKRIGKSESVIIDGLIPATAYDITIQTEDDQPSV